MHGIFIDGVSKVSPDSTGVCFFRIRRTHDFTILENGAFTFQHLYHYRTGDHEVHQVLEEGALLVDGVEALGLRLSQLRHPGGDDAQAGLLEATESAKASYALGMRLTVAASVGVAVALGVLRILLGWPIHVVIMIGYLVVVLMTMVAPPENSSQFADRATA